MINFRISSALFIKTKDFFKGSNAISCHEIYTKLPAEEKGSVKYEIM